MRRILGYDIRHNIIAYGNTLTSKNYYSKFLIRPEIPWPISIDKLVWPSIYIFDKQPIPPVYSSLFYQKIKSASFYQQIINFFESPDQCKGNDNKGNIHICVKLHFNKNELKDTYLRRIVDLLKHDQGKLDKQYSEFMGFDLANCTGISGLCNFGQSESLLQNKRKEWSGYINRYGLFEKYAMAQKFQTFLNETTVEEEIPFYIFSIWTTKPDRESIDLFSRA